MQNSKIYQSPCLNSHAFSFDSINVLTRQKHTLASPCRPVITQDFQKKYPAIQTSFSSLPQGKSQDKTTLADGAHQAKHHISLIEDPLWKRVCADLVRMLGVKMMESFPTVRLWDCRLDDLSGRDKIVTIYCLTEHTAQFLEQYVFIVLDGLHQYFPALKEIRINNEAEARLLHCYR